VHEAWHLVQLRLFVNTKQGKPKVIRLQYHTLVIVGQSQWTVLKKEMQILQKSSDCANNVIPTDLVLYVLEVVHAAQRRKLFSSFASTPIQLRCTSVCRKIHDVNKKRNRYHQTKHNTVQNEARLSLAHTLNPSLELAP
jgi:hypothetical protein